MLLPSITAHASREIAPAQDALALYARLRSGVAPWLLESSLVDARLGRFHFLGADPWCIARVRGRALEVEILRAADGSARRDRLRLDGDPFASLRALLPRAPADVRTPLPFVGGLVGWLGYPLSEASLGVALRGRDDLGLPDALLLGVDRCVAIEAATGRTWLCALGLADDADSAHARAQRGLDALARALDARPPRAATPARARSASAREAGERAAELDAGSYAKAVDAILEEIAAGNVYQACFTQRTTREYHGDAFTLYRALRRINPAPFAACLESPDVAVIGSSPERFLSVSSGGEVECRPIKGTRPRGATPEQDAQLRGELLASPKERAENVMIVDLVRNDLGRVCAQGSIHVPELQRVEAYATLFQLVSTVRGRLAPGCDAFAAARACFPPGSMTGAPKHAAVQLLDRLESGRRGIYSGALGYFDVRGGADLSVVIRSALLQNGRLCLHAGGGVVADSRPFAEHAEAEQKLLPLLRALAEAEEIG